MGWWVYHDIGSICIFEGCYMVLVPPTKNPIFYSGDRSLEHMVYSIRTSFSALCIIMDMNGVSAIYNEPFSHFGAFIHSWFQRQSLSRTIYSSHTTVVSLVSQPLSHTLFRSSLPPRPLLLHTCGNKKLPYGMRRINHHHS